MVIFLCEESTDGILTGVYDAWSSRLGHECVALRIDAQMDLELFAEYRKVDTNAQKAQKVARSVQKKMGMEAWQTIYQASLCAALDRADCIYRVIVLGMSPHVGQHTARRIIWNLQNPDVARIFELSRKTGNEAHRYLQFVRFRELESGVLFSEIHAENQVLPLIGDHFSDRFPNENFMIYDSGHGDCLIHGRSRPWFILRDTKPDTLAADRTSALEQDMQKLWRGFCKSITIDERKNLHLQQQFWPLKYRPWMTERE